MDLDEENLIILSFYFKTQTKIIKGTIKWLDLGKSMVSCLFLILGRGFGEEKDEMRVC